MLLSRFQRDILAHRSAGSVAVPEAEEIVLVADAFSHATAEAGHLLENLGDIFRGLICGSRLLVGEKRWGKYIRRLHIGCGLIHFTGRIAQGPPRDGGEDRNGDDAEYQVLFIGRVQ